MPSRNSIKKYIERGVYHIYNRGIDKRDIFLDERDYKTFLFFLKIYLTDPKVLENTLQGSNPCRIERKNFSGDIELLAYCLMPNHFHLLIRQNSKNSIAEFMKCIAMNYSMYFNKKYKRIGTLFQGRYKAILIEKDNYLLHLSRYIHLNPTVAVMKGTVPCKNNFSSYADYLGKRNTEWVKPEFILDIFNNDLESKKDSISSYKEFVEGYQRDSKEILGKLTLE